MLASRRLPRVLPAGNTKPFTRTMPLTAAWLLLSSLHGPQAAEVVDDLGYTVRIEQQARRIVSLAPHATELVFSAGAGHKMVGAVEYSDYPPEAKAVTRIGDAARLDRERILSLEPDLIIGWDSGNNRRDLDWLRGRGIPLYLSRPQKLEQIAENIRELGILADTSEQADRVSADFMTRLDSLRHRYGSAASIPVFFQLWPRPLMTVSGQHFVNDVLALCGGKNIFADLPGPAPTVALEAVIGRDPEIILAAVLPDDASDPVALWRQWPQLEATRKNRVFGIRADLIHRPGIRILDGAEQICKKLTD